MVSGTATASTIERIEKTKCGNIQGTWMPVVKYRYRIDVDDTSRQAIASRASAGRPMRAG